MSKANYDDFRSMVDDVLSGATYVGNTMRHFRDGPTVDEAYKLERKGVTAEQVDLVRCASELLVRLLEDLEKTVVSGSGERET